MKAWINQCNLGDCLEVMRGMPENSVDSIVTDPPYGLSFMGKKWDYDVPSTEIWAECLRVLKPGGHLLAFAGTRTQHRMAVRIEDAGFEIRDMIAWVYGSGFPKSLDVSKAIDKMAGRLESGESVQALKETLISLFDASGKTRKAIDVECGFRASNYLTLPGNDKRPDPWVNVLPSKEKWVVIKRTLGCDTDISGRLDVLFAEAEREVIGRQTKARSTSGASALPTMGGKVVYKSWDITAPATEAAAQWQGWGTALKPALEPITMARKPLIGTVAANVLAHGTGGLNIDGCRVDAGDGRPLIESKSEASLNAFGSGLNGSRSAGVTTHGRWPANLILSDDPDVVAAFPQAKGQQGALTGSEPSSKTTNTFGEFAGRAPSEPRGDTGSAARFFYCAKASKEDRNDGCHGMQEMQYSHDGRETPIDNAYQRNSSNSSNSHPTVKPTDLMRYLCRLVTPIGGIILDPFMGSGSTGRGAVLEGFRFIGIEREAQYFEIAKARISSAERQGHQPNLFAEAA